MNVGTGSSSFSDRCGHTVHSYLLNYSLALDEEIVLFILVINRIVSNKFIAFFV